MHLKPNWKSFSSKSGKNEMKWRLCSHLTKLQLMLSIAPVIDYSYSTIIYSSNLFNTFLFMFEVEIPYIISYSFHQCACLLFICYWYGIWEYKRIYFGTFSSISLSSLSLLHFMVSHWIVFFSSMISSLYTAFLFSLFYGFKLQNKS